MLALCSRAVISLISDTLLLPHHLDHNQRQAAIFYFFFFYPEFTGTLLNGQFKHKQEEQK